MGLGSDIKKLETLGSHGRIKLVSLALKLCVFRFF